MSVALTSESLRIGCDRKGCNAVIVHISFLDETDAEDYTPRMVEEAFPPVEKHSPQEPSRWLCEACMAGAQSGAIKVRWKR